MRLSTLLFGLVLFSSLSFAGSWQGYLVDVMCSGKPDLSNHTKKCAMKCAKSGFGIKLSDGTFLRFDEAGNQKAMEALKQTNREKDLQVEVQGEQEGEVIKVEAIRFL